ncbi:MAG: hypothetical protein HY237_07770 [Acidobacteria bacterium]|nr:hypothetical protein [Acidobacteriota bacterium]
MSYEVPEKPLPGLEAFQQRGDVAVLSQAAVLLLLGSQLRGDAQALLNRAVGSEQFVEAVPDEDLDALRVPRLAASPGLIDPQRARRFLNRRYGQLISETISGAVEVPLPEEVLVDIAGSFFRETTAENATDLMEACIRHPHELVRVAAAVAYLERSPESGRLTSVLERGTYSTEELVRDLAATGLAQAAPSHVRISQLQSKGEQRARSAEADTTLLVHGTWARNNSWWQPGGDFHTYVLQNVRSDLYSQQDRFEWSGGYSDDARALAAHDLWAWVDDRSEQGLDLITHSHGGSVAMLANKNGLNIRELVLLSCPVHMPQYQPDFTKVRKVLSIRVHFDLVILADRGGQRFRHPQIQENVLPIWFDHTATHNPDVWKRYNVPAMR